MGLTLYQLVSSADISKPVRLRLGWTKLLDTLMVFMKDFLEKKGLLLKKKTAAKTAKIMQRVKNDLVRLSVFKLQTACIIIRLDKLYGLSCWIAAYAG